MGSCTSPESVHVRYLVIGPVGTLADRRLTSETPAIAPALFVSFNRHGDEEVNVPAANW